MIPVHKDLGLLNNLLIFLQLRLYGALDVPPDGDPGWSNQDPVQWDKLCPYKRNIPVYTGMKWNEI